MLKGRETTGNRSSGQAINTGKLHVVDPLTSHMVNEQRKGRSSAIIAALGLLGSLGLLACPGGPHSGGTNASSARSEGQSQNQGQGEDGAQRARERVQVDVFAFGRQIGQLAPCGCTSDPLGGLQFAFGRIATESKAGARLIVEPGSFLYPSSDLPEAPRDAAGWAQAEQRALTLHQSFSAFGADLVSGLGPADFAKPGDADPLTRYPLPRVLANLSAEGRAAAPSVLDHRIVKVGPGLEAVVSAVVEARTVKGVTSFPALSKDAAASATAALAKGKDAELSVLIVAGSTEFAKDLARQVDVDVIVVGGQLRGKDRQAVGYPAARVGDTWILEPGERAQTLSHLQLQLDAAKPSEAMRGVWTVVPTRASLAKDVAQAGEKLAKLQADPKADASFIANLKAQQDELAKELADYKLPDDLALALFSQEKVTCRGPKDESAQTALRAYDTWVAAANKKKFTGVEAPSPNRGQVGYVGGNECANCHEEAAEFWKGTVHAGAYETLVVANKQFDLSCVSCHVTGFREPGGSEVVETKGLVDVQCEQCHGPGGAHIEDPSTYLLQAETPESTCATCHTPEHSDTFDYPAYLRDILGEGHGAKAREALGPGPLGRELRAAALKKAGGGCPKM